MRIVRYMTTYCEKCEHEGRKPEDCDTCRVVEIKYDTKTIRPAENSKAATRS